MIEQVQDNIEVEIDFDIDYRKKKRKLKIRRLTTFLIFLLVIISITFILMSDKSKLKKIEVVENEYISSEEIIKFAKVNVDDSLVKVYLTEIKDNILLLEGIKDVEVNFDKYNELIIVVEEEPALFTTGESYYMATGNKLETSTSYPAILFANFDEVEDSELVISELITLQEFHPEVYDFISQISYEPDIRNDDRLVFVMRDTNKVYVNPEDINRVLKRYFSIVDSIYSEYGIVHGEMDMDKSGEFRPYD